MGVDEGRSAASTTGQLSKQRVTPWIIEWSERALIDLHLSYDLKTPLTFHRSLVYLFQNAKYTEFFLNNLKKNRQYVATWYPGRYIAILINH